MKKISNVYDIFNENGDIDIYKVNNYLSKIINNNRTSYNSMLENKRAVASISMMTALYTVTSPDRLIFFISEKDGVLRRFNISIFFDPIDLKERKIPFRIVEYRINKYTNVVPIYEYEVILHHILISSGIVDIESIREHIDFSQFYT